MNRTFLASLAAFAVCMLSFASAHADDYVITLKDNSFSPAILNVPAKQKLTVTIKNLNAGPAEFESSDLDREKVVGGGSEIHVLLGPLDPGTYVYYNDFHRETSGSIVAK